MLDASPSTSECSRWTFLRSRRTASNCTVAGVTSVNPLYELVGIPSPTGYQL